MIKKKKLLIVAAFPPKGKKIIGGIEKSSRLLSESKYFKEFKLIKFDTSQISHPAPNFLIRLFLALIRVIRFILSIIFHRPNSALIFCSDGWSAFEKGIMVIICKFFYVKSFIFPRAGNLIIQTRSNKVFRWIIRHLFSKSNYFLCQGPTWHNYALNDLLIDKSRVTIINNWTATQDIIKIGKNRVINNNTNSLNILYVGWLEKQKGINELLHSCNDLISDYNIKIQLIGDGSLRNNIESYIVEKNIQNNFSLLGWLNDEEILSNLKKADIFVLPSWYEGMPNALIEALASGLPTISTSVGIISDYIIDNYNGILVQPKNQLNLKKAIEKTINDVNLRNKLSKNGIDLAENLFSEDVSLKKLSDIIKEI